MRSKFIVFSGIDGAGKTTQIERLREFLAQSNIKNDYIWIRGGYTSGFEKIKGLLRRNTNSVIIPPSGNNPERRAAFSKPIIRRIWLILAIIDLIRVIKFEIPRFLRNGTTIICDRYLLDTLVDFKINFPQEKIENWPLWKLLQKTALKPDISFLLLIPVDESIRRSDIKREPFRDTREILATRYDCYRSLSKNFSYHLIDGLNSPDQVTEKILGILEQNLFVNLK